MTVFIEDEGQFVCVESVEGGRYMRLQCPAIQESATKLALDDNPRDYLWYKMVQKGWLVTDPRELEEMYQAAKKEQSNAS